LNKKLLLILFLVNTIFLSAESISIFEMQNNAELALKEHDLFNSIAIFKKIIEINPSFFDSHLGLSKAYFLLGEYSEASKQINDALFLNRQSLEAKILNGRILTGQGKFVPAREIFDSVLLEQKNNMDAILGIAELEVAEGNIIIAIELYKNLLKKFPGNRKALISSIILFDSIKKNNISDEYVTQVLFLYPEHPYINYIASKHYYETGNIKNALIYATRSYDIDPAIEDNIYLLSLIYISLEKYDKAVTIIENSLDNERDNPEMWYILGEIYKKSGNIDKSIYCYATSLGYASQNELSRLALESTLIEFKAINDPLREKYAKYHFQNGISLIDRNYGDQAKDEFRRGLLLFPHSLKGQKLYANLMKTKGFLSKYLSLLTSIHSNLPDDSELNDEIEIYKSIISDTVSNRWDVDQFSIDAPRYHIEIFLNSNSIPFNPLNEGFYLGEYLIHSMHSFENIEATFNNISTDFTNAYKISRKSGSDYFLIYDFIDTSRSFSMEAKVYHSGTGSLLVTIPLFRTGNQKIILSINKLSLIMSESLPVWGEIIDRSFNKVLINSGNIHGTKTGDVFFIIRNEDLSLKKDLIGLDFDPQMLLGEVNITNTDDLVSEGILEKYNFFDLINPGDSIIKKTDTMNFTKNEDSRVKKSLSVDLYKSIISIP